MINLVCLSEGPLLWIDGSAKDNPPSALVDCCFGAASLRRPQGLYAIAPVGLQIEDRDTVSFSPFFFDRRIMAGIFTFRGFQFLLSVWDEPVPQGLPQLGISESQQPDNLLYHPKIFQMDCSGRRSQVLRLTWT
jgi:hypothetical protein